MATRKSETQEEGIKDTIFNTVLRYVSAAGVIVLLFFMVTYFVAFHQYITSHATWGEWFHLNSDRLDRVNHLGNSVIYSALFILAVTLIGTAWDHREAIVLALRLPDHKVRRRRTTN